MVLKAVIDMMEKGIGMVTAGAGNDEKTTVTCNNIEAPRTLVSQANFFWYKMIWDDWWDTPCHLYL